MASKRGRKKNYSFAVGRRRRATARARLYKGKSPSTVNGQPIEEYFKGMISPISWKTPFNLTGTEGKYYVTVKVNGGGKKGQYDAVIHAIAKALNDENQEKYRKPLKQAKLLTRDSRRRERRKTGTGGKARRKKQSPKR